MKKAGRLAAAVFAAMLLVTGCGAPAEKKAVETTPEQSSKIEQKEEAKNLKDRKSTRLNSSHWLQSRMPSSA